MDFLFTSMIICLILIILGLSKETICSDLSNTLYNESYSSCPISFIRRKRAQAEYSRWTPIDGTTQEFIVQVLDDEVTTPKTNPVIAINIQPVTKVAEKIIVGGVIVPPRSTSQGPPTETRDYTRFVLPINTLPVTRVDELFLAPQLRALDKIPPIKPQGRNSQRDESPPASPQFLLRTPTLLARQYAPVDPVSFTRRSTLSPQKPTSSHNVYERSEIPPPRSSKVPDTFWPLRTKSDIEDVYVVDSSLKYNISDIATRSTTITTHSPLRTTATAAVKDETGTSFRAVSDLKNIVSNIIKNNKEGSNLENIYDEEIYSDDVSDNSNKKGDWKLSDTDVKETETESNTINYTENNNNVTENELEMEYEDENYRTISNHKANIDSRTKNVTQYDSINKHRHECSLVKLRKLNVNTLYTLAEINSQLKHWAETSPLVKWEDITNGNLTTMDNPIYVMIVDDPSSGQIVSAKQTVMIVAGIQGRDHHAVAAAMYVLYELIERTDSHSDILRKYRFWIIPVFNPDGYDYSTTFPLRREWSKNLRQNWDKCRHRDSCSSCKQYGVRCTVQACYGVNLDRNFEYQWIPAEELRAEQPCGQLYAGARQLSEAETGALTRFLHEKHTLLFAFIAFKEGEVLVSGQRLACLSIAAAWAGGVASEGVMYPYSHTRKLRAFDHIYRQRASRAAAAAYSISGRAYVAGQTSEFLPLYAGGIEDWVDGHLGIDNTYGIMMFRPTDSYNSKLITERVVHEAFAAMDTLLLQSVEPLGPPIVSLKKINSSKRNSPTFFIIIYVVFLQFHKNVL